MRVSVRIQKLYYSLATCGCLAGAGTVIAWGARPASITPAVPTNAAPRAATTRVPSASGERAPTREDFAQLWDRPLRRALYDPPPPKAVVRELPPLNVELLGTIIEAENSMAIVRTEQGRVEYKRVGESIGPTDSPASVVEIGPEEIVVERSAERISLHVRTTDLR